MEWKFYLNHKDKTYRVFKLRQDGSSDITVIPKAAAYLPSSVISDLEIGSMLEIRYDSLKGAVDHFTAHAKSGQRHYKLGMKSFASDPILGTSFEQIDNVVPLLTMIAVVSDASFEVPSGKWFGLNLPDDVNYAVFDLFAFPKNSNLDIHTNYTIVNEKTSKESFFRQPIEMRSCSLYLVGRFTNHDLTDIQQNFVFQLSEGRTAIVSRVEKGKILAQVADFQTEKRLIVPEQILKKL